MGHLNCSKCPHSTSIYRLNLFGKLVHAVLQRWRNYHMYGLPDVEYRVSVTFAPPCISTHQTHDAGPKCSRSTPANQYNHLYQLILLDSDRLYTISIITNNNRIEVWLTHSHKAIMRREIIGELKLKELYSTFTNFLTSFKKYTN